MDIVIVHGQNHKSSTYFVARTLAEKIGGDIKEFFLPKDFDEFCIGCANCFMKDEKKCPHYEKLKPFTESLDNADVIILASPVYVLHSTGSMKAFLDHYAYRCMIHRPEASMFKKQGVCISTAAGSGTQSANKDMADSLLFWGVAKRYRFGINVATISWNRVSEKKRKAIDKATSKIAKKILHNSKRVKPSIKTIFYFYIMRHIQIKGFNPPDVAY